MSFFLYCNGHPATFAQDGIVRPSVSQFEGQLILGFEDVLTASAMMLLHFGCTYTTSKGHNLTEDEWRECHQSVADSHRNLIHVGKGVWTCDLCTYFYEIRAEGACQGNLDPKEGAPSDEPHGRECQPKSRNGASRASGSLNSRMRSLQQISGLSRSSGGMRMARRQKN